jgi:hypothetical protein
MAYVCSAESLHCCWCSAKGELCRVLLLLGFVTVAACSPVATAAAAAAGCKRQRVYCEHVSTRCCASCQSLW